MAYYIIDKVAKLSYNMTTNIRRRYMMNGEISIRPSKDIRTNYAEVSALAHQHPAVSYTHLDVYKRQGF